MYDHPDQSLCCVSCAADKECWCKQVPVPPSTDAPAKMALGGQEGFRVNDADKYTTVEEQSLVVMPHQLEIPLPNAALPEIVLSAIAAVTVRAHASMLVHKARLHASESSHVSCNALVVPGPDTPSTCDIKKPHSLLRSAGRPLSCAAQ